MLERKSERVAQAVEHVTFNHGVAGSSPAALTKQIKYLPEFLLIARKPVWALCGQIDCRVLAGTRIASISVLGDCWVA
jgi:hypothetical protein